jgi:hypothetical protein
VYGDDEAASARWRTLAAIAIHDEPGPHRLP